MSARKSRIRPSALALRFHERTHASSACARPLERAVLNGADSATQWHGMAQHQQRAAAGSRSVVEHELRLPHLPGHSL